MDFLVCPSWGGTGDLWFIFIYFSLTLPVSYNHRHLRIYRLLNGMYRLPCFFISAINGHCNKKRKEKKKLTLGRPMLEMGPQQTLSNLF
jgi:hypothetical protein